MLAKSSQQYTIIRLSLVHNHQWKMFKCDIIQNRNIKIPGTHRVNDIIIKSMVCFFNFISYHPRKFTVPWLKNMRQEKNH